MNLLCFVDFNFHDQIDDNAQSFFFFFLFFKLEPSFQVGTSQSDSILKFLCKGDKAKVKNNVKQFEYRLVRTEHIY